MGMAATENYYSAIGSLPYYGPPGVGLNAGVIMMNLTRMRRMAGGGFIGSVRSVSQSESLIMSLISLSLMYYHRMSYCHYSHIL